jgi:predicted deacylase
MKRLDHLLQSQSLGTHTTLSSFHYGTPGRGPKVYIQASLHAEELPAMLTAHHLRALLDVADQQGQVQGEIVLVPVANPIGLAQRVDHKPMGRFELASSENFNRNFPDLARAVGPEVLPRLGADAQANVRLVREAIARYLKEQRPANALQDLRLALLGWAHDADHVLDLHCDCEAVLHFYTEETCWKSLAPLAHYLGAEAVLLARNSGGSPFDECLSGVWWQLAEQASAAGIQCPLPQACCSTTIELRGEADVGHDWARADAQAIWSFLQHLGVVGGASVPIPAPRCLPTPLAGSETLRAKVPGIVVFAAQPGDRLKAGDLVAEVIDPLSGQVHPVLAGVSGTFYARIRERYALAGAELSKIAGSEAFRTGMLLGD